MLILVMTIIEINLTDLSLIGRNMFPSLEMIKMLALQVLIYSILSLAVRTIIAFAFFLIEGPFSPYQRNELEKSFKKNPWAIMATQLQLAEKTGLTIHQVKVWFENRRRKIKTTLRFCPRKSAIKKTPKLHSGSMKNHQKQQKQKALGTAKSELRF